MQASLSKYDLIADPNEIIISVSNPTEVKTTLSSHTVYTIQGNDLTGGFTIVRRYSDFDHVRLLMIKNWPGCYIPPIPRKKAIGNNEFVFVESRREGLNEFCREISMLKHLWYSAEFQILIRGKQDVQKVCFARYKGFEIITPIKLQGNFSQVPIKIQIIASQRTRIELTYPSIKLPSVYKENSNFGLSKQSTRYILDSYDTNLEQYEILLKYVFPEYEKHFLSTYINGSSDDKLVFANSNQKMIGKIQEWKKCADEKKVEAFYLLLEKEERELEAFLDVFKSRHAYESLLKQHQIKDKDLLLEQNKLNAGKQSFFKSIIKANIEQDKKAIGVLIDLNQEKIRQLTEFSNLMTVLMADYEIPRFQEYKIQKYYETVRIVAEFQMRLATLKEQICDFVLQNDNSAKIESDISA